MSIRAEAVDALDLPERFGFRQHGGCKQMRFRDLRRRVLEVGEGLTIIAGLGQQGGC